MRRSTTVDLLIHIKQLFHINYETYKSKEKTEKQVSQNENSINLSTSFLSIKTEKLI